MATAAKVETGVQLLARLRGRPSLVGLEAALFGSCGPPPGALVEFYGEEGRGKTQALQHLIATAILPKTWRGIDLQGQGVSVILIDTEYHFCLLRLASILENRIHFSAQGQTEGTTQGQTQGQPQGQTQGQVIGAPSEADIDILIKECMQRLFVVRCNSTTQLIMSLYSLESLLNSKLDIAMLALDSVSAFYWMDRGVTSDSTSAKNSPQQRTLTALQYLIKTFGIFTVFTRAALFSSKFKDSGDGEGNDAQDKRVSEQVNYLGRQWQQAVSCAYVFSTDTDINGQFTLTVSFSPRDGQSVVKRPFRVTSCGLQFMPS